MKKTLFWINLIAGGLLLVLAALALFLPYHFAGSTYKDTMDAKEGWFYVDKNGQVTTRETNLHDFFDGEDKETVISRTVKATDLGGGDLCFISTNVNFSVLPDGDPGSGPAAAGRSNGRAPDRLSLQIS